VNYCRGYTVYLLNLFTAELLITVFLALITLNTSNSVKRGISEIERCKRLETMHQNVEKDILPSLKVQKLYYGKEQLQYKLTSQDFQIRLRPDAIRHLSKRSC